MNPTTVLPCGLTAIDLFQLHAPAAPDWFEPNMRAYENMKPDLYKQNEVYVWDRLVVRERCLQWPLFWATQQVTRSVAGPAQFIGPMEVTRKPRRAR